MSNGTGRMQITAAALLGSAAGVVIALALQEESPGDRIHKIARDQRSVLAVVAGKEGELAMTDPLEGKVIPSCDQQACEVEVKISEFGEPVLVKRGTSDPVPNTKQSKIYHWSWRESYCQGTHSSGTTTVNCCSSASCW